MNKIIVVVANNNDCIESLKKAGDSIGVEIKSEIQSEGKIINKKPIIATEEEQEENSRSKSAKLRIFEKIIK